MSEIEEIVNPETIALARDKKEILVVPGPLDLETFFRLGEMCCWNLIVRT